MENETVSKMQDIEFKICTNQNIVQVNPPVTARVKISQNVDIPAKVYLVHLKVEHCQTLRVARTFTGQSESTVFDLVKASSCIVQGGQNDSKNRSKMPLRAHLGQQSKQSVD